MTERIASVLMVLVGVYGGAYFAIAEEDAMAVVFGFLTLFAFWTMHVVWTAPVFHEGD